MRFHVGSDHGGVELRRQLADALQAWGHEVASELGPTSSSESTDYPDVATQLSRSVAAESGSFGVLVCGTGQGVAITANKVPGIRAGVVADTFSARMLREHNDANVLCVGARVVGPGLAQAILKEFVESSFEGGRHARRVDKIRALDHSGSEGAPKGS